MWSGAGLWTSSPTEQAESPGVGADSSSGFRRSDLGDAESEADLIRRARDGDVDAYAVLLRSHEQAARRLASLICGDEGDDATQEAFVKSWRALSCYRREGSFRGWLLRIVANEARNRRRAASRRHHHEWRLAEDRASGETVASPELAVLNEEQRRALLNAVEALPHRLRDVVVSRHLVGLSEAETALALDIPTGTVKSRLARGLDRLRTSWEKAAEREGHQRG
jgi:RNA polymerase sigma-70 factor (ECF subfamily)